MALFSAEAGREERSHQLKRQLRTHHPSANAQYVHVIVLHTLMSGVVIVTHARPDPGNLVRRDRHPNSATADQDSPLHLMLVESQCDGFGKVRVVHRRSAVCTEIQHLVVDQQARLDELLELETGMISGESNPHELT